MDFFLEFLIHYLELMNVNLKIKPETNTNV